MPLKLVSVLFCFAWTQSLCQPIYPHSNAHAHNDYEHQQPLFEALKNGFMSVEADIHLRKGSLVVDHNSSSERSPSLEKLYLKPLDSLLRKNNGKIYATPAADTFYLMLDIKTNAEPTWQLLKQMLSSYPALCNTAGFRIFLSGNRPIQLIQMEKNSCVGIDGRPADLGKNYSEAFMPVISDHFGNWSRWNGKSAPTDKDLAEIRSLVQRVHNEKKKLRLWSIPDNQVAWEALLNAGVDFINTDQLGELNTFLTKKGL